MSATRLLAAGVVVIVLMALGLAILPHVIALFDHLDASVGRIGR